MNIFVQSGIAQSGAHKKVRQGAEKRGKAQRKRARQGALQKQARENTGFNGLF